MAGNKDISDIFIGFIMFTLIIGAGIGMIGIFKVEDPTFTDGSKYEDFDSSFNQIANLTEQIESLEGNVETSEESGFFKETFGFLNSLISKSWNVLKLLFSGVGFMKVALIGWTTIFGVPAWIPALLFLIITVVIAFIIYEYIFRQ